MTRERGGVATPSKLAITKALAEAETRRKRAIRYSLLALLLPLTAGAGLLGYTFYKVRQNLLLNEQLVANNNKLLDEEKRLKASVNDLAAVLNEFSKSASEAKGEEQLKALQSKILNTVESSASVAVAAPRVFIHYTSEGQRPKAGEVARALRALGYVVPDLERVARAPRSTDVRYFRAEDKDAAGRVAGVLRDAGLPNVTTNRLAAKAAPGQLEVWFPMEAPSAEPGESSSDVAGAGAPAGPGGTVTVLRGDFRSVEAALAYARELSLRELPHPVEVYRQRDGRFYVTLGGYTTNEEAERRKAYARRNGLGTGAYNSTHAVGENLFR